MRDAAMALPLALGILAGGCALDTSGLGPGSGAPARAHCPPGTVDANANPADGCEYACTPTSPATELCDGIDNDCDPSTDDGSADPGNAVPCDGPDTDACAEGTMLCRGGRLVCDDPTSNAQELCNGEDDDCDGTVDEEAGTRLWLDRDGDGWGGIGEGMPSCDPIAGWVPATGDCDDVTFEINPNALETCNLVDDDCNDLVDDGVGCGCVGEPHDGRTYYFCNPSAEWRDARDWCGDRAMSLVTVNDAGENAWLRGRMTEYAPGRWWIGLNDRGDEGRFGWHSGSGATYRNWASGEPNDGGGDWLAEEDCTEMVETGTWNDESCNDGRPWVCETP